MTSQEIRQQLSLIFENVFGEKDIEITDDLTADHINRWDSLTHLTMIAETEKAFGIRFKLKELVNMKNVGELISLISQKLA